MCSLSGENILCYLIEITMVEELGHEWRAGLSNLPFEATVHGTTPVQAHEALAGKLERNIRCYSPVMFSVEVKIGQHLNGEQRYLALYVTSEDGEKLMSVMESMAVAA